MKNIERVIQHLQHLDRNYYGRIVIRIRNGQAVLITDERDTRLDEEAQGEEKAQ